MVSENENDQSRTARSNRSLKSSSVRSDEDGIDEIRVNHNHNHNHSNNAPIVRQPPDFEGEGSMAMTRTMPAATFPSEHVTGSESSSSEPYRGDRSFWYFWNRFLAAAYPFILLTVVLWLWPVGFFAFHSMLQQTDSTFHSPVPGTSSAMAQQVMQQRFQDEINESLNPSLFAVWHTKQNNVSLVNNDYVRNSSLQLQEYLNEQLQGSRNDENADGWKVQVSSYYSFQQERLSLLGKAFLSGNQRTAIVQVQLQSPPTPHNQTLTTTSPSTKIIREQVMTTMENYYYQNQTFLPYHIDVGLTGLNFFSRDLRSSTRQDLRRRDSWVLPLALVMVGATLMLQTRNETTSFHNLTSQQHKTNIWRNLQFFILILILPLVGMISSVACWSVIMNTWIVSRMKIKQFTPSIMMSLTLGMGIDYSLFLLARYSSETQKIHRQQQQQQGGREPATEAFDIIQVMLEQAGHVVLVSGTTLLCTFLGLMALPLPMLQSVGVGAAVAITSAMWINLLVLPALLYTPLWNKGLRDNSNIMTSELQEDMDQNEFQEPLLAPERSSSLQEDSPQMVSNRYHKSSSIWIRLARQVLHPYKSVIITLVVMQFLLFPVAWNAKRLNSSDISFESLLPANAPSLHTYYQLAQDFGPGKLAPFRLIVDGSSKNTTIDSAKSFALQQDLVSFLLENRSSEASFSGISMANNTVIPYSIYASSKNCHNCSNEGIRCLHVVGNKTVTRDRLATYLMVELQSTSPFDPDGTQWLEETRRRMNSWSSSIDHSHLKVYLDGTPAIAHDAVEAVYQSFPRVIVTTLAVVFLLLGFVFRSVVPPLRSVISITFTLAVSFGLAVLVYQDGVLSTLHLRTFSAVEPELSWLVPIMSFSIIVGLALDYDVFLVSRILELRLEDAYGHESSIAAGLDSTGTIITSAGIIMAISFGSLLSSQNPALDQWAFLLTVAVLLDTFLVRTVLVPAMMGWTGAKHTWYPRLTPTPQTRLEGFDIDLCDNQDLPFLSRPNSLSENQGTGSGQSGRRGTMETVHFDTMELPEDSSEE